MSRNVPSLHWQLPRGTMASGGVWMFRMKLEGQEMQSVDWSELEHERQEGWQSSQISLPFLNWPSRQGQVFAISWNGVMQLSQLLLEPEQVLQFMAQASQMFGVFI